MADITEHEKTNNYHRMSEYLFRTFADNTSTAIFLPRNHSNIAICRNGGCHLCITIRGKGMRRRIAPFEGHTSTHALQCQHSSGYKITGTFPLREPKKTSLWHISAHLPHLLHFLLSITGGILPPYSLPFKDWPVFRFPYRK